MGLSLNIPFAKYWGVAGSISYGKTLTTIHFPISYTGDMGFDSYSGQPWFENPLTVRFGLGIQYMF